jgi:glycosyltransferase involved in cell wall biosynthesis
MKNVVCLSHSAELNGAELWLLETIEGLDRRRFSPTLVFPRRGPLEEEAKRLGIASEIVPMKWWLTERRGIWRQPLAWLLNRAGVRRLENIIREKKADLVFTNSAASFAGALAAKRARVPHVWAIHEILGGRKPFLRYLFGQRALVRFILGSSAKVIVNSQASRTAFPYNGRVAVIPNGIGVSRADESRQKRLRLELGIRESDLAVGIVGKIYEGKGQREAVQAASLLMPRFPNLKLLIVGDVKDRRYEKSLRRIVRENKIEANVIFAGYRSDLVDVFPLMRAVVVASVVDSFGRVALEALAAGVPVVAVRAGGLPEIIRSGENGLLTDSRSPAEIAQAINLIFENPGRAEAFAVEGRRTVSEKFSLDKQIQAVERVFHYVLDD